MPVHVRLPDIDAWKAQVKCQAVSPVSTDAGRYVQLIADGADEAAYLVARAPNPFASVCGRVCAAPCEDACRRGNIDAPISIRALKRHVTERYGVESLRSDTQDRLRERPILEGNLFSGHLPVVPLSGHAARRKVAVVGAGPAGMSAAHDLALLGYDNEQGVVGLARRLGHCLGGSVCELIAGTDNERIERIFAIVEEVRFFLTIFPFFILRSLARLFRVLLGFDKKINVDRFFFGYLPDHSAQDVIVMLPDPVPVKFARDLYDHLNTIEGYQLRLREPRVISLTGHLAFDEKRISSQTLAKSILYLNKMTLVTNMLIHTCVKPKKTNNIR